MRRKVIRAAAVLCCVLITSSLVCLYPWAKQNQLEDGEPAAYAVLQDDMGTKLTISVPANIDEKQLRATLRKAADDHQYDDARDLLLSDFLWIEAFLVNGETRSSVPAARMRRYVPPRNADKNARTWLDWVAKVAGRSDMFSISLAEAKRSLG